MFLACSFFFLSGVYGVSGDFIATSLQLSPVVIHCNFLIQCSTMVFSRFSWFTVHVSRLWNFQFQWLLLDASSRIEQQVRNILHHRKEAHQVEEHLVIKAILPKGRFKGKYIF